MTFGIKLTIRKACILFFLVSLPFLHCQANAIDDSSSHREKRAKSSSIILYKKPRIQDKRICLTFDDGPNPYATLKILDVLDEYKIKATFFLLGSKVKKYPEIVKEIAKREHIIALHSFSHPLFFFTYSPNAQKEQLERSEFSLRDIGVNNSKYFRPPNVIYLPKMSESLRGYTIVGANHYVGDNFIFSSKTIASKVVRSVKNRGGGILVLHDGAVAIFAPSRKILPEALKIMIPELISEGYNFCSLDEIGDSDVIIKAE
jgi:peptidoglycan/xylan/chitin deacetylase (PgdA/CDA1 family)